MGAGWLFFEQVLSQEQPTKEARTQAARQDTMSVFMKAILQGTFKNAKKNR